MHEIWKILSPFYSTPLCSPRNPSSYKVHRYVAHSLRIHARGFEMNFYSPWIGMVFNDGTLWKTREQQAVFCDLWKHYLFDISAIFCHSISAVSFVVECRVSILKPRTAVFPIGFATGQSHNRTFFPSVREHFLLFPPRVSASRKKCKRILPRRIIKFNLLGILILFLACRRLNSSRQS